MNNLAFCVPTTTHKREWKTAEETYLYEILFSELEKWTPSGFDITVFVGYDDDDKVWSHVNERMKCNAVFTKFNIEWIPFGKEVKGKPTWIWNELAYEAVRRDYEYIKVLGDDIRLPRDTAWLSCFVKKLKKNKNIGFVAGWSNNNQIPTQFLIHKTHLDIFGFVYPPEIDNWGCDNWMADIYPKKWALWLKSYPLLNVGGDPRYDIIFSEKFVASLVRRYKPKFNKFLNEINK
jgi:hypothetical protein